MTAKYGSTEREKYFVHVRQQIMHLKWILAISIYFVDREILLLCWWIRSNLHRSFAC